MNVNGDAACAGATMIAWSLGLEALTMSDLASRKSRLAAAL
jgi:hypothetical protein